MVFIVLCLFIITHINNRPDNNCHEDMTGKRGEECHKMNEIRLVYEKSLEWCI